MKIGLCSSPPQAADLPAQAYDYLEAHVQNDLVPEKDQASFQAARAASRPARPILAANCFLPASLKCVGPDVDESRLQRYAKSAFARAQSIGIQHIVFGSGGARSIPEGFARSRAEEQMKALLCEIGPLADAHQVTLVIEPLNRKECNFVNSLAEGAELVDACGHPQIRLLADYYHMLMEEEPVSEVSRHGHLIHHTHVAELQGRSFPGKFGEDFRPFFEALRKVEYPGNVSLECAWGDRQAELASATAYLRSQMVA